MIDRPDPNQLSYIDTWEAVRSGTLEPVVDRGMVSRAVNADLVSLSTATNLSNYITIGSAVLGIALAFFSAWWWVLAGLAGAIGNTRVSSRLLARDVVEQAQASPMLFDTLRSGRALWFRWKD